MAIDRWRNENINILIKYMYVIITNMDRYRQIHGFTQIHIGKHINIFINKIDIRTVYKPINKEI